MAFTEITFVEPETAQEAYVDVDVDTGEVSRIYIGRDADVLCDFHDDADRLEGLEWVPSQNPLFMDCGDVPRFFAYLLDEWELSSDDQAGWRDLMDRFPSLDSLGR